MFILIYISFGVKMDVKMCSTLSQEHKLFKVENVNETLLNFPYAVKGRNSDAAVAKKKSQQSFTP